MAALYQLAVLGAPTNAQIEALETCIKQALEVFGLHLGEDVQWEVCPAEFRPHQLQPSAVVFFGGPAANLSPLHNLTLDNLAQLLERGIPVIPVISHFSQASVELPDLLRPFDYLDYAVGGAEFIATALLEAVGLLPQQRKVFLSYCREELSETGTQLFEILSARHFEVFINHDENAPDSQFSCQLWHRLCDSDVLLMLDTPTYFERRWTNVEFGRALAKGVSVLRVNWPACAPSSRALASSLVQLAGDDLDLDSRQLKEGALQQICMKLEEVRSQSYAVRFVNLRSKIRIAVEASGGKLIGVGAHQMAYVQLANGTPLRVKLTLGVPAFNIEGITQSDALLYDPVGLHPAWLAQNTMLAGKQAYPWLSANEADLHFAYWKD